ncbi:hypothetical protein HELRODRAFT_159593 [Helobdella robusta]|uniref:DH domain-containing protein n=1 Tax=Helobdella robusta TaxID=6412 RepID=T1EP78_HELRO|nr:hypothetical protein HELRODRAFT_159593 [Helobdella robusta]ESO12999.1 hypothetical protein HELRODRAFT_159593 [Helobdella robusta]
MEPLKAVQVEGHLMNAEPRELFGNLDEVCLVTHTFCTEFIEMLLMEATETEVGQTIVLLKALSRFCQLTRDGEVYHEYCLNYSKAIVCLEQLRKSEDFVRFEKWCIRDPRCHRLHLTDLLISPMQHCTKVPLLLSNIIKYTNDDEDKRVIRMTSQKLEASLKNLEAKMTWLKNFERMQEIQRQVIWLPITELEPKSYIPEFIRPLLNHQPCERLLANPTRQLVHEGPVCLLEVSKTVDMYMFLFDDILLLTKIKKEVARQQRGDVIVFLLEDWWNETRACKLDFGNFLSRERVCVGWDYFKKNCKKNIHILELKGFFEHFELIHDKN